MNGTLVSCLSFLVRFISFGPATLLFHPLLCLLLHLIVLCLIKIWNVNQRNLYRIRLPFSFHRIPLEFIHHHHHHQSSTYYASSARRTVHDLLTTFTKLVYDFTPYPFESETARA